MNTFSDGALCFISLIMCIFAKYT